MYFLHCKRKVKVMFCTAHFHDWRMKPPGVIRSIDHVCIQRRSHTHYTPILQHEMFYLMIFFFPRVDSLSLFRSVCEASHSWQVFSSRPVSQKHYTLSVCLDQVLKQDRSGRFWHGSLRFTAHPVKLSLCPECGNSQSNQSHGLPWAVSCWISASESGVWENKCVFILPLSSGQDALRV